MSRPGAEQALREALGELEAAGAALRARSRASVAEALVEAWGRIADPERALGRRARADLPSSSGLSLENVAWALAATFDDLEGSVAESVRRMEPPPGAKESPHRLGALILAGNVFTACVQPLTFALLARVPILVKASSKDDVLPRIFADALAAVDPELAAACTVVSFRGGDASLEATLLSRASVVSAYGSDVTLASLRARLSASAAFVGHGHGLGVGLATASALASDADAVARAFALDVAAYDQRGCMSPHAIVVEAGEVSGADFARRLADALDAIEDELPRGALPSGVGASQIQWRGLCATRGELFERRASAVAHDPAGAIRPSPGYRNVLVVTVSSLEAFAARVDGLGAHLKTIGVAGDVASVARALPPSVVPRVCPAGQMQRPGLLALADGQLPWTGLQRFIDLA